MAVAVCKDLGNNGKRQRLMTVSNNMGDDVDDDLVNGDNGGNDAGNNTGTDTGRDGDGVILAEKCGGGGGGGGGGGSGNNGDGNCGCILQGSFAFYCEDIVWYFYDI